MDEVAGEKLEMGIGPEQLVRAAGEVFAAFRGARLVKNNVGNLAVMAEGAYVGFVDLQTGEVEWSEGVSLPWKR